MHDRHFDWPICPSCRLRTSYDEETGECFACLTGREIDAQLREDAGEDRSDVFRRRDVHAPNVPPSAA